jgi:hypothetical protein
LRSPTYLTLTSSPKPLRRFSRRHDEDCSKGGNPWFFPWRVAALSR